MYELPFLKVFICSYVRENKLRAPFVMTCCGSLTRATIRFASHTPADGNNKVEMMIIVTLYNATWLLGPDF